MPSISWQVALAVVFVLGILLYALGGQILRRTGPPGLAWPQLIDESAIELDRQAKLELIERLGVVGTRWSERILEQAAREERDDEFRHVIAAALAECRSAIGRT